eukprot:scaffold128476_cov23-Cyclotella_meneghiniana.AAC.1
MHKTPHLLGSEVLYFLDEVNSQEWDSWHCPLAEGIHNLASDFLARLTNSPSIPSTSMLIAYISIAQGGLGLLDPHTRAIPDFIITMASAIRAATNGFQVDRDEPNVTLPLSLARHFSATHNCASPILHNFHQFLPAIAARATPDGLTDPITHFVHRTSIKSARDRLHQQASFRRSASLYQQASPSVHAELSELLIASSSFPLIAMARSVKSHRRPNDLFIIALKHKLYLDIFPPTNLPTCLCSATIDSRGRHVFNCKRISKWACHNCIRNGGAP